MKLWTLLFCFLSIQLISQKQIDAGTIADINKPLFEISYDQEQIDLGTVKRGEKKEFAFTLTNTGKEAAEIDIVSSCDCTTLDWPIRPIKPGESATIDVIFDSAEKEKSEVVDVDISYKNVDPKTGRSIFKILTYKFDLVQ